mmetsp:Transcript_85481/g.246743  ORF Transcript_85481/g.246743 Transcript_85481/m.246743 type:complete len:200 (-) Transcript_85481:177-776(-)
MMASFFTPQGSGCVWFLQACETATTMSPAFGTWKQAAGKSWQRGIGDNRFSKALSFKSLMHLLSSGSRAKGCTSSSASSSEAWPVIAVGLLASITDDVPPHCEQPPSGVTHLLLPVVDVADDCFDIMSPPKRPLLALLLRLVVHARGSGEVSETACSIFRSGEKARMPREDRGVLVGPPEDLGVALPVMWRSTPESARP